MMCFKKITDIQFINEWGYIKKGFYNKKVIGVGPVTLDDSLKDFSQVINEILPQSK